MPGKANPMNNPGAEHRSMHAQEKLAELGFEVKDAQDFIYENLTSLDTIFQLCLDYGIDTDMIAEIMDLEDVDGTAVANFFATNGIDATGLGGSLATIDVVYELEFEDETSEIESEESVDSDVEDVEIAVTGTVSDTAVSTDAGLLV